MLSSKVKYSLGCSQFLAKERVSQLRQQNQTKRSQLLPLQAQLQIVSAQGASQHSARQLKLRDNDRLVQKRLQDTRRALLAKLSEVGQPGIAGASNRYISPIESRHPPEIRLGFTSSSPLRRSHRGLSTSLSMSLEGLKGYVGGAAHALHVTVVAARYLGVSLPFELECREPSLTLYLHHHHHQYQQLSDLPLFEIEAKKEHQVVLIAMIGYNTLYLHHLQEPISGITNNPSIGLGSVPFNLMGPQGLSRFLSGCRTISGRTVALAGPGLDPTFNIDFNHVLMTIRGGQPHHVHDNHFPPDLNLKASGFRDEDYDLAITKSQLPPPESLNSYHQVEFHDSEEDSFEFVDCVLPPTPSELAAAGI
ncbi:hypothetical protein DSO57_1027247 [Entomophthora muscae]|uniref:Uncharacterized protein n=2 Tax=Entomophthora muscae TaxID=34485 RepID=A0ACC2TP46_9FUNG|nr:hypothetical protein DSO57_1014860 [Entomophthora muscae]KAJ9076340.1 hypothetical protein DSO57_1027247 [Entomophthora muscae]